jgi:hypothetical protein
MLPSARPLNPFREQSIGVIFTVIGADVTTVKALAPLCIRATLGGET